MTRTLIDQSFNNAGESISMKKYLVVALIIISMIATGAAQSSSDDYEVKYRYFDLNEDVNGLDTYDDYTAIGTKPATNDADETLASLFFYNDGELVWERDADTYEAVEDVAAHSRGLVAAHSSGECTYLPASTESGTVPDQPIEFDNLSDTDNTASFVEQTDDRVYCASQGFGEDSEVEVKSYDAGQVFNRDRNPSGSSQTYDEEKWDVRNLETSDGKVWVNLQRAGLDNYGNEIRTYDADLSNEKVWADSQDTNYDIEEMAVSEDYVAYQYSEGGTTDNFGVQIWEKDGKEEIADIDSDQVSDVKQIAISGEKVFLYREEGMYVYTLNENELEKIFSASSGTPTFDQEWLVSEGNTFTYALGDKALTETNIDTSDSGSLSAFSDWFFGDLVGLEGDSKDYAQASTIIILFTVIMGLAAGRQGGSLGALLGVVFSSASGLLPVEIVFILAGIVAIALAKMISGSGGGNPNGGGM